MGLNILEDYIHESKAVEESSSFMTAVPAGDSFNRDTITDVGDFLICIVHIL